MLAGIVLGAWIDDFTRVSGTTVWIAAFLAVAAWVIEYLSGVMGAQKAGASKEAIVGALMGTRLGIAAIPGHLADGVLRSDEIRRLAHRYFVSVIRPPP